MTPRHPPRALGDLTTPIRRRLAAVPAAAVPAWRTRRLATRRRPGNDPFTDSEGYSLVEIKMMPLPHVCLCGQTSGLSESSRGRALGGTPAAPAHRPGG